VSKAQEPGLLGLPTYTQLPGSDEQRHLVLKLVNLAWNRGSGFCTGRAAQKFAMGSSGPSGLSKR